MARALSGCSLLAAFADGVAFVARRRGYSTAAASAATGNGRFSAAADADWTLRRSAAASTTESSSSASASSWLPDPATGFYRPASRSGEVDVAELRQMLLKHRS